MPFEIHESYVNATEKVRFGESEWFEPYSDTRGGIFRDCQKEYGGCISKMYRDVRIRKGRGFTAFGVTVSPADKWEVREVGWIFSKRMRYEDARPRYGKYSEKDYYTREVWVEVRET